MYATQPIPTGLAEPYFAPVAQRIGQMSWLWQGIFDAAAMPSGVAAR